MCVGMSVHDGQKLGPSGRVLGIDFGASNISIQILPVSTLG